MPSWCTAAQAEAQWSQVLLPGLQAVIASGNPVGLVLSGRLAEHPELPNLNNSQIEHVGTLLHEPMVATVPERDAIGQLKAHTSLLRRTLGARPTGAWLPWGAWDRDVPLIWRRAGMHWTAVDRRSLQGCPAASVLSVERLGKTIAVVPSTPLEPTAWTGLAVMSLKTGHDLQILNAALPRTDALPSTLAHGSRARAYLEGDRRWERSMRADPALDRMHKRMLSVSRMVRRVAQTVERTKHVDGGPDPLLLEQARRYLYRAQAGAAWFEAGTFRDRAWRDLIRTESVALDALPLPLPWTRSVDEDCDGIQETRVVTETWAASWAGSCQGALVELSHRPSAVNLVGTTLGAAFQERWNDGVPVALEWSLVTTESPQPGSATLTTLAESVLDGVPLQVLKTLSVPASGSASVGFEVRPVHQGVNGRLSTELFLALGGNHLEGEDCALSVEVAGGRVPLDEPIDLPGLDAVALCGWRARVDLTMEPAARVQIEPMEHGAARVQLSWPVEVLAGEVDRKLVRVAVREAVHG